MARTAGRAARSGPETRQSILDVSQRLFAEKGYLGASLSDIVSDVGIAKPSLFHHFPNKERLYAAVLEKIAGTLEPIVSTCRDHTDPVEGLILTARSLDQWCENNPEATCIVMRDMLDIGNRAAPPKSWPLAFFVESLADAHDKLPASTSLAALPFPAFLSLFLGSLNYAHVSRGTLTAMGKADQQGLTSASGNLVEFLKDLLQPHS